jgi:hypothetical protein
MQGQNAISDFKIRAGWGQTGNQDIGGYLWGAAIGKMPSNLGMGFRQTNIANPYITWEKQEQYNVGLDLGFIQNRIALVLDIYLKNSTATWEQAAMSQFACNRLWVILVKLKIKVWKSL